MITNAASQLAVEIRDMLRVGYVGLYEFPSFLADAYDELRWADKVRVFEAVLEDILASGDARLTWEVWAKFDLSRDASEAEVDQDAWKWPWPSNDETDAATAFLALTPVVPEKRHWWQRRVSKGSTSGERDFRSE